MNIRINTLNKGDEDDDDDNDNTKHIIKVYYSPTNAQVII